MANSNGRTISIVGGIVAGLIAAGGLSWTISSAFAAQRYSDLEKRLTKAEVTTDAFREFRGEVKSDMGYLKSRMDEVLLLVRRHIGEAP